MVIYWILNVIHTFLNLILGLAVFFASFWLFNNNMEEYDRIEGVDLERRRRERMEEIRIILFFYGCFKPTSSTTRTSRISESSEATSSDESIESQMPPPYSSLK
ncbi:hypothetical protein GCK72_001533 [Caenorhabditis remanei]|uniref:Uncharacterized protein n=1 Tax=Caenorhabditis remanei TaxID=31234 RepID=A0A6A5HSL4_CAERE|nr:hypothetical protein GCK72_001533 [Caenorhabditis remanei]KAF1769716.1 hypothetical protein GCK72_001533 [Caenorhabditis remanei]